MSDLSLNAKLDRALGKMDAVMGLQEDQSKTLRELSERVAKVEAGVTETKEIVDAWTTAKTSFRFIKWALGIAGAIIGIVFAVKGGVSK